MSMKRGEREAKENKDGESEKRRERFLEIVMHTA